MPGLFKNRVILHPTDFSATAAAAFELACSLARDQGAQLIVVHVDRPPLTYDEIAATREEGYREQLQVRLHAVRPIDSSIPVTHLLAEGDPATVIVDTAEAQGCDLIVMGTHGRTGLGRLFMGSVAEHVLREAKCPVLTVKAQPAPAETQQPGEAVAGTGR